MRHKPALKYCGVTIELEFPGRFDKQQLIDGSSSHILREALDPLRLNRYAFDIRTRDCKDPYQEGTRVVLLAGDSSLEKIGYRRERINTLRGSPFKDERTGIISIPTYHPQQATDRKNYELTYNPFAAASIGADGSDKEDEDDDESSAKDMGKTARRNFRFWFIQDLRKAVDISRRGLRQNVARYHTNLQPIEILDILRSAGGSGRETLYFDIECERTTGRIVCFAFSFNAKDIYVAPILDHTGQPMYGLSFAANVFRELAAAFSRCTVVAHNGPFDFFITLWRYHIPPPRQDFIYDTFIAQSRIHVDVEKSLGHCGSLWTHQPYHKDEGEVFYGTQEGYNRYLIYNAKDVELTALIHQEQLLTLEKDPGLRDSVMQGCQLIRPLILKSYRGLRLNSDKLCKKIDELNTRATWIINKLLAPLAGGPINPRSSQKVGELLYTKFGLPRSTDPTISLTGKDALYKLALKFPIPILPLIHHSRRSLREAGHLSAKLWRDSHTTCSYVIPGTKTFRLSSRKLLGTFGTNLQNWSKKMRQLVVAGSGYKLVQVDQAGAEALIVAYLAPPGRYRDLFIHKVSPHVYLSLYLFPDVWKAELGYDIRYLYEATIAECKADPRWVEISRCIKASDNNPSSKRYYYFSKQVNHSSNYDVTAPAYAMNMLKKSEGEIWLPIHECDRQLTVYHNLYPEIRAGFQSWVIKCIQTTRTLRNLFGYPRHFYGNVDDVSVRKDAFSWVPQSTVGVITGRADSSLQRRIDADELDFLEVWQNNHDSLLARCRDEDVTQTARVMMEAMNQRMVSPRGEEFAMRSEASVGDNWYDMEAIEV